MPTQDVSKDITPENFYGSLTFFFANSLKDSSLNSFPRNLPEDFLLNSYKASLKRFFRNVVEKSF